MSQDNYIYESDCKFEKIIRKIDFYSKKKKKSLKDEEILEKYNNKLKDYIL